MLFMYMDVKYWLYGTDRKEDGGSGYEVLAHVGKAEIRRRRGCDVYVSKAVFYNFELCGAIAPMVVI